MDIRPSGGPFGAEVSGIDLGRGLDEADFRRLRQAFLEHGILFFREQDLSPEQHIAFARHWGEINVNRFFRPVEDYPQIAEVLKEPQQQSNIGGTWHADHSYDAVPALGSILYAREVPPKGGDTLFANMQLAYDALSHGLKRTLAGLQAVHSSRHVFGGQRGEDDSDRRIGNPELATQDAVHPVVLRHPESGRKGLYVNPQFTLRFEGWSDEESRPLLEYLYAHATRADFVHRFRWAKGSIAFWDNRATWHRAVNDYHGARRLMHRITLEGVALQ